MPSPFDAITAGLNRAVMATFGASVVMIAPDGRRFGVVADWRQDPVLIEDGHAAVSTYQAVLGLDLHTWPSGVALPDQDWLVEIPVGFSAAEDRSGTWEISDPQRPGGGWMDLYLTNRTPFV